MNKIVSKLISNIQSNNSNLCIGLDPDINRIPELFLKSDDIETNVELFLKSIIDITKDHCCCYKLQKAYFDILPGGHELMKNIIKYIKSNSDLVVIMDCKVGDIDNTMSIYLKNILSELNADIIILNPYMGGDVFEELKGMNSKAGMCLVRTSNNQSHQIQNLITSEGSKVWQTVLKNMTNSWSHDNNLIPVMSVKINPIEYKDVRLIIGEELPIFVVGFGVQGDDLQALKYLNNSSNTGVIVNSSRAILYPLQAKGVQWDKTVKLAVVNANEQITKSLI
jgi:orotidine-5'-phosphate decarboxylase